MKRFATRPFSPLLTWGYPLLPLLVLAFYAPTISPGVTFSDGGEIATAIASLGVIHPTGYPIFTILAHLFVSLPLGLEPVVEISLFNCLLSAFAASLVALSVRELALIADRRIGRSKWRTRVPDPVAVPCAWLADATGLLAGFVLAMAPLVWHQVRIPEVYPLHVFLTAAALLAWIRFEVTRQENYILWAALVMGLGLAHHVTMAYMLPAAAVYLLIRRPMFFVAWLVYPATLILRRVLRRPHLLRQVSFEGWWRFPVACLIGALPMLSYTYLLWATEHTSGIPWGGVDTWKDLYNHVTGKQYRHYMRGFGYDQLPKRVGYLPGTVEREVLTAGGIVAGFGLLVMLRRLTSFALLLVILGGSNIAHALQYGVGDYKTYYLPALIGMAITFGIGVWRIAHLWRVRRSGVPLWAFALGNALLFAALGAQLYYFGFRHARSLVGRPALMWITLGFAVLGLAVAAGFVLARYRHHSSLRGQRFVQLPATIFVATAVIYVVAAGVRAEDFYDTPVVGAKHAESVAHEVPPGAVYMTMGDGYLFTQWYYQHVMEQGKDFAVAKLRGPTQDWYRDLYLPSRFPKDCDPLWGRHARDPEAYARHCEDFEDRVELKPQKSWLKIAKGGYRHRAIRSLEKQKQFRREGPPIKRGNDPRCKGASYRSKNSVECHCWNYHSRPYRYNEQCVHSAEDGGMAPMTKIGIYAHRIVQDHIHERPVYERNVYTDRARKSKNKRDWSGPARLRPSGDYALINRGRSNQLVLSKDVDGLDPCASDTLQRIPQPTLKKRRKKRLPWAQRTLYKPNPWPTLLKSSHMTASAEGTADDSSYRFEPGNTIHLRLEWFERYHYDPQKRSHKGDRITHGIRLCAYAPNGRRMWTDTAVSGTHSESRVELPLGAAAPKGRYVIQACTVGEVQGFKVPTSLPCQRPIMEVDVFVGTDPRRPGPQEQRAKVLAAGQQRG